MRWYIETEDADNTPPKEITATDFVNKMKNLYDSQEWNYNEIHFSLLDLMSNLESMEIDRR